MRSHAKFGCSSFNINGDIEKIRFLLCATVAFERIRIFENEPISEESGKICYLRNFELGR